MMLALFLIILGILLITTSASEIGKNDPKTDKKERWVFSSWFLGCLFPLIGVFLFNFSKPNILSVSNIHLLKTILGASFIALGIVLLTLAMANSIGTGRTIASLLLGTFVLISGFTCLFAPFRFEQIIEETLIVNPRQLALALGSIILVWIFFNEIWREKHLPIRLSFIGEKLSSEKQETSYKHWIGILAGAFFLALLLEPQLNLLFQRATGFNTPLVQIQLSKGESQSKESSAEYFDGQPLISSEGIINTLQNFIIFFDFYNILNPNDRLSGKPFSEYYKERIDSLSQLKKFFKESGFLEFIRNNSHPIENIPMLLERKFQAYCWAEILAKFDKEKSVSLPEQKFCQNRIQVNHVNKPEYENIYKNPLYIITYSNLLWFSGDKEKSSHILRKSLEHFLYPFELFPLEELYSYILLSKNKDSFQEEIELAVMNFESSLNQLENGNKFLDQAEIYFKKNSISSTKYVISTTETVEELRARLDWMKLNLKNILAYYYSRGLIQENLAKRYIKDLQLAMDNNRSWENAYWLDTIGYVILKFSHNDVNKIKEAILIFEQAERKAKMKYLVEKREIIAGEKSYLLKTIRAHIKVARSLL
ncbi:MAG: hypothetical protein R3B95_19370 [Nitrospirales bacterium]|nr:hypothetical protein [Nitrospirales bacterium]